MPHAPALAPRMSHSIWAKRSLVCRAFEGCPLPLFLPPFYSCGNKSESVHDVDAVHSHPIATRQHLDRIRVNF